MTPVKLQASFAMGDEMEGELVSDVSLHVTVMPRQGGELKLT